ncbi:predicted protein, partial [Nematostella vectensis]
MDRLRDWVSWSSERRGKALPGPWGLPFVGSLPHIAMHAMPHLVLTDLGKTYGDVYGLSLGAWNTVVLNSLGAAREALVQNAENFSSRPPNWQTLQALGTHKYSVAFGDYNSVQTQRKKALLRMFHQALISRADILNDVVTSEVDLLNSKLAASGPDPQDPRDLIIRASFRTQFRLSFGEHVTDEVERELMEISKAGRKFQESSNLAFLTDFLPWTRLALKKPLDKFEENIRALMDFVRKIYLERRQTYENEEQESCHASAITKHLSSFMTTSHMEEGQKQVEKKEIENQVVATLAADTFGAGLENVSSSLLWAVAYIASHDELQDELRDEIMRVVGNDRVPILQDKGNMPLLQATILETFRLGSALPLTIPHYCNKSCTVKGFEVREGSLVLVNLWGINHDPRYFCDPYVFEPHRFLDLAGELRGDRCSSAIPFGIGHRACAG